MEQRKKVAVLLPWLKMGGTNKIGLNFMRELSGYCDVTLILSRYTGELLDELPEHIPLIVDTMRPFRDILKEDLRRLRLGKLWRDALYYGRIRLGRDNVDNYRYLVRRHGPVCDTEFDCAISYHGQSPEGLLNLLYRVRAKKKVAWIHGEFGNSEDHCRRMNAYYERLDRLFFVSGQTMESFLRRFAIPRSRCTVYYNPIDWEAVMTRAQMPCDPPLDPGFINLVTVGRLSVEKGQDMIPAVTRRLLDDGYPVRWYVIGDGDTRPVLNRLCGEHGVREQVHLLGTRTNPYPFMAGCDIYVQPSYTEGYSTTICEAGILGKPIVGTKSAGGIREQLENGESGLIVDATANGLYEGIRTLIENEPLRRSLGERVSRRDFSGAGEIRKFLEFLY